MKTWEEYAIGVAQQAELRKQSHIPDLDTFWRIRRATSGAYPTISLHEMDLNIPDKIRQHPALVELEKLAVEMICIANDVVSYNKEQAVGDDQHNIITVVMKQLGLDLQHGFDRVGEMNTAKIERFHVLYRDLPRWLGPVDLDVQKLVDGIAMCVSGVLHWGYETQRYFGKRGLEIKAARYLNLLPKVVDEKLGPVPVDDAKL